MNAGDANKSAGILLDAMDLIRQDPAVSDAFGFDEMLRTDLLLRALPSRGFDGPRNDEEVPRMVRDTDVSQLQEYLQAKGLRRLNQGVTHQAIALSAREQPFHRLRDWLSSLKWDGVRRVEEWMPRYLGVDNSPYARGIGRMFLTAMVARIFQPGCKCDYMLVLEGPQGARKSTACSILGGEWFSDNLPDVRVGKDVSQHLRGKWLIEISELSAMSRAEDATLKAFLSRTVETYRPTYGKCEVSEPRQCVFIGTTNKAKYLRDETGGRRYWPVSVGSIDTDLLAADRELLFAEAAQIYRAPGAHWWPDPAFEAEHIRPQQEERFEVDLWEEAVKRFIEPRERVGVAEVLRDGIGLDMSKAGRSDQLRVINILTHAAWRPVRDGKGRGYVRCDA